ncbi:MAG: cupin domain-containing protein [Bacteroidota bacterium]
MKKRDAIVAAITIAIMCLPVAIIARKYYQSVNLPSSVFDWTTIKVTPTKTGERRQFFQSPTATLDELECHVSTLNPGETAHPPHKHPEEEMTIVKDGTVEVLVNGELKTVGPGSLVFQAANTMHNIKNVGSTQAVYFAIKWKSVKTERPVKVD